MLVLAGLERVKFIQFVRKIFGIGAKPVPRGSGEERGQSGLLQHHWANPELIKIF